MERLMFWMDYKVNIHVHILHRYNFGLSVTYMSKEEANGEFHGHLARFPYTYGIYDTNDGDCMKVMKQVIYEG